MKKIWTTEHALRSHPVGQCIYCGAVDTELGEEHIIPLCLGGKYILTDASCSTCETITGRFEQRIARGFMRDSRVVGNFPTRNKRDRPTHLPLTLRRGGETFTVLVPAAQHPGILHLPLFRPAAVLTNQQRGVGLHVEGWEAIQFGPSPAAALLSHNAEELIISVRWDVSDYARLLAKVAYGFLIAQCGPVDRDRVPVLPLILGTADDASDWIGSADFTLDAENQNMLHVVGFRDVPDPRDAAHRLVVARVKLFASSGVSGHEVVVLDGY